MTFIVIENDGEAETLGMRLMGASSKTNEQIGRFGTGWKYGIAGVLRLAGPFQVAIGSRLLEVGMRQVTLRGTEHREATIEGEPIGITDQLGKDWEPWMVLREFISNAIDEGSCSVTLSDHLTPQTGKTKVFIPLEPFREAFESLDEHFCLGPVEGEFRTPLGRAIPKSTSARTRIFKRGVLVHRTDQVGAFDYELSAIQLGEDRMAGDARPALWDFLDSAPVEVKRAAIRHAFEAEAYRYQDPSPSWKEAFDGKLVVHSGTGAEDELVLAWNWVRVATQVGARTLDSDLSARAAKRETMPATPAVRDACRKLEKIGVHLDPRVVLVAKLTEDVIVEGGLTYVSRSLDAAGTFEALLVAATSDGCIGSTRHAMVLAGIVRRLVRS